MNSAASVTVVNICFNLSVSEIGLLATKGLLAKFHLEELVLSIVWHRYRKRRGFSLSLFL